MDLNKKTFQAIVIGSGAGCGALIHTLIKNNFDPSEILILERGSLMPKNTSAASRFVSTYENGGVVPCFGKPPIPFALANCIGGGPEINGSLIWKTPKHIKEKWFDNFHLPFQKETFDYYLNLFDKLLEVKDSHISDDHDYASFLINNAATKLGIKCVPARRSLKYSCCSNNLCAFGSTEDLRNTPLNKILKKHIDNGLVIVNNIRKISFEFDNREGPYFVNFKSGNTFYKAKTKKIFLSAGTINSPLIVSNLKGKIYSRYKLRFHINLKSIGILTSKSPDVPGTMFSAQVQEYEKDDQYIMPFNWHKAHVATILDRHSDQIDFDSIYNYGLGVTSQVSTEQTTCTLSSLTLGSRSLKFIKHELLNHPDNINAINGILERTYNIFRELGIKKVLSPIKNSGILEIQDALKLINQNKNDLDLLSVHHMSSLPIGGKDVNLNGSLRNLPNIFVADGSILPSFVGESPQLTIMAFIASLYKDISP